MKIVRPMDVGDAALVSSTVPENDAPAWSASTVYAQGGTVISTAAHKVYESLTSSTSGAVTLTIAAPCVMTWPGTAPAADTPLQLSTTGTLPTGLTAGTVYYVKSPSGSTSNLSATPGGAAINTSGSQSGTHSVVASQNFNKDPTLAANAPHWLDTGATNRWRLFDEVVGQQCSAASPITVVITPSQRCNTAALFNLDAATVTVVVTSASEGEVYNQSFDLADDGGIADWYSWFFEPISRLSELVVSDLPAHADTEVTVTIAGTGTVGCGELVIGLSREIGDALWGAELGIRDYSVKEQDDFGNWRILERAFSRRATIPVWVEASFTDALIRLLSAYRAAPVVWIGIDHVTSTYIYGYYRDFSVVLESFPKSLCNLELEGLT